MAASTAVQAKTAERRRQALQMRLAGVDYATIGARLGITPVLARKDVSRSLAEARAGQAEAALELRDLQHEQLERLRAGLWAQAVAGDTTAVTAVLRILDRQARLHGLDVPVVQRTEITGAGGAPIDPTAALREQLDRLAAARTPTPAPEPESVAEPGAGAAPSGP